MIPKNKKQAILWHNNILKKSVKRKGCNYFYCIFTDYGEVVYRHGKTESKNLVMAYQAISQYYTSVCVLSYKGKIYSIIKTTEL